MSSSTCRFEALREVADGLELEARAGETHAGEAPERRLLLVPAWVGRLGCRATVSFESLQIRIRLIFLQNSGRYGNI